MMEEKHHKGSKDEFMQRWNDRMKKGIICLNPREQSEQDKEREKAYWEKVRNKADIKHMIDTLTESELLKQYHRVYCFLIEREGKQVIKHDDSTARKIANFVLWGCGREAAYTQHKGILLMGGTGTGKTHVVDSLRILTKGSHRAIVKHEAADLWDKIRKDEISPTVTKKILFIDDLGNEPSEAKEYGNIIMPLERIINEREKMTRQQGIPTIATTNLTPDELEDKYGSRCARRIRNSFHIIDFGLDRGAFY